MRLFREDLLSAPEGGGKCLGGGSESENRDHDDGGDGWRWGVRDGAGMW